MLKFNAMCSCETCRIVDEVVPTGSCGLSKSYVSKNKKGIIQTKNISSNKTFYTKRRMCLCDRSRSKASGLNIVIDCGN